MSLKMYRTEIVVICCILLLGACRQPGDARVTPEAAKQVLKLRGYEFDEKAFLAAVTASDVVAINAFLAAGMNVNVKDESEGDTALMLAASIGELATVNALLKGGADINAKNKKGRGALARALAYKHDEVAELLLAQAALDLNAPGPGGASPLIIYVRRNVEQTVSNILDRGANVNLQDDDGDTAINSAVVTGNVKVLRLLLAKGADPNIKNKLGGTALMWCGTYGRDELAQVLLDHGADPRAKDNEGKSSAYWAGRNGYEKLAKVFREAESQAAGGRRQEAGPTRGHGN